MSLRVSRDGALWIGTMRGLEMEEWQLTRYPDLAGMVIASILEDRDGRVWVLAATPSSHSSFVYRNAHQQSIKARIFPKSVQVLEGFYEDIPKSFLSQLREHRENL